MSKIPITKQLLEEFSENSSNHIERLNSESETSISPIKNRLRLSLLEHPKFNPYNYSSTSVHFNEKAGNRKNPYNLFRQITSGIRVLPDFILIGGTRSGVMTLTKYIHEHPNVYTVRNIHLS